MIDTELMSRLLAAVPNNTLVIMLGDSDQLPSVAPGDVLRDMINSGLFEFYKLTEIFRQAEDSSIINNSHKVINGDSRLIEDNSFKIIRFESEDEIAEYLKLCVPKMYKANIEFKMFTPSRHKKFKTSTTMLNKISQNIIHEPKENDIYFGNNRFTEGDNVVFIRNNYEVGYYNGQEGVITNIQKNNGIYFISILSDEGTITITDDYIDDLDLGYAITAHKSQGGECKNALIVVPMEPKSLLKRQLLYVEITRARKNVVILSEKDAYKTAISNYGEFLRKTGLKNRLEEK